MTRQTPVRTIPGVACASCGGRLIRRNILGLDGPVGTETWCTGCRKVDPPTVARQSDSLQARLRRGEQLGAIECQTVERQLNRRLRLDPDDQDAARLLREVRRQMGDPL